MTIGRTDDPENPSGATAFEAASLFGAGSRIPSGPAAKLPRQQAGHMTAIDPIVRFLDFSLASKGPSTHAPAKAGGATAGAEANRSFMNATKSSSVRVSPIVPRTWPVATSNPRSGLSCHAGCTRTRAVRRALASLAGFWRRVPGPGSRSSRRPKRSDHLVRPRRAPPGIPRKSWRISRRSRDQALVSASNG